MGWFSGVIRRADPLATGRLILRVKGLCSRAAAYGENGENSENLLSRRVFTVFTVFTRPQCQEMRCALMDGLPPWGPDAPSTMLSRCGKSAAKVLSSDSLNPCL